MDRCVPCGEGFRAPLCTWDSGDRLGGFDDRSCFELVPGGDTELREDPVQVEPDGAVREVELLADLSVREPFGSQLGDGELLRRQPVPRLVDAASARLP